MIFSPQKEVKTPLYELKNLNNNQNGGGNKACVLSYYSHRSYGKDIKKSLKEFPKQCDDWNRQIVALALTPEVKLKKK